MDNQCLFAKLGGQDNINTAVEKFYVRVLADAKVNHFFKNVDMKKQTHQQQTFLTLCFGGPNNYNGKDMKAAHAGMGITNADFDAIIGHLGGALAEMGVSADIIKEVAAVGETTRADIVEK